MAKSTVTSINSKQAPYIYWKFRIYSFCNEMVHRIVDDHHLQVPTVLLIMQASRQEYPRMFLISAAHPKSQGTSNHRKFRKM